MSYLTAIDTGIEKIISKPLISITCIILIGFLIRIYFTPWNLPTNSFDSIKY